VNLGVDLQPGDAVNSRSELSLLRLIGIHDARIWLLGWHDRRKAQQHQREYRLNRMEKTGRHTISVTEEETSKGKNQCALKCSLSRGCVT
jgi:hypothetical protein